MREVKPMRDSTMIDIVIIGAGPVGASLALMLAQANAALNVALIDGRQLSLDAQGEHPLERTLALSTHSFSMLKAHGVQLPGTGTIEKIHVSERGRFGQTTLAAKELQLAALGHTVLYSQLIMALDRRINELTHSPNREALKLFFGQTVKAISIEDSSTTITLNDDVKIAARMIVVADGGNSLSLLPGISISTHEYNKTAVLAQLIVDRSMGATAYERFTEDGPLALLPITSLRTVDEYRASMVWVTSPDLAAELVASDAAQFVNRFQNLFGRRAGKFTAVESRKSYPLRHRVVEPRVGKRYVVIGNAAQTLHPVAGQGLNLGLRDAKTLCDTLKNGIVDDVGSHAMLARYNDARQSDASSTAEFTRFIVDVFERDTPLIRAGRNAALTALDMLPMARRALVSRLIYGASSGEQR